MTAYTLTYTPTGEAQTLTGDPPSALTKCKFTSEWAPGVPVFPLFSLRAELLRQIKGMEEARVGNWTLKQGGLE